MKSARANMIHVPLDGYTIPTRCRPWGCRDPAQTASRGTGIIAGGAVPDRRGQWYPRHLTKSLGSGNVFNRAMAASGAEALISRGRGRAARHRPGAARRTIVDPYAEAEAEESLAAEEEEAVEFEQALMGDDEDER